MWDLTPTPHGLSVYGHALVRTSPDLAMIRVGVTRRDKKPADSLLRAKEGARDVAEFLRKSSVDDFGMSRISLNQDFNYRADDSQASLPYFATIQFNVTIGQLDRLEEIISGVVKAGANDRLFTQFRTSKLKDVRMQARHLAIEAAKEKGAVYAREAGISLGRIIHMQEIRNPEFMQSAQIQMSAQFGMTDGTFDRDSGVKTTLEPDAIEVVAGVLVTFSLEQ
jgi:uncharacterized protein YggE